MGHLRHKVLILGGAAAIVLVALALLSFLSRAPLPIFSPQEEGPTPEEVAAAHEERARILSRISTESEESQPADGSAERLRMLEALSEE